MIVNGYKIEPRANLRGVYLRSADLRSADLRSANLRGADLSDADLRGADLSDADLSDADLWSADFRGAYLRSADLRSANLRGAYLRGANLWGVNLRGANLWCADLRGVYLPPTQVCPEEGSFIAFKKTNKGVVKLLVTEDAKRLNSIGSRKCRASKVKVLEGFEGATGTHYSDLFYETGATLEVKDFCDDVRVECAEGIHFFITRKEAEDWT